MRADQSISEQSTSEQIRSDQIRSEQIEIVILSKALDVGKVCQIRRGREGKEVVWSGKKWEGLERKGKVR